MFPFAKHPLSPTLPKMGRPNLSERERVRRTETILRELIFNPRGCVKSAACELGITHAVAQKHATSLGLACFWTTPEERNHLIQRRAASI
jgi:hypothetical protein